MNTTRQVLTIKQVAEFLQVSTDTVYDDIRQMKKAPEDAGFLEIKLGCTYPGVPSIRCAVSSTP